MSNKNITTARIIRYDVIDGSVNDAFTIHTETLDQAEADAARENPRHYVAKVVGLSASVHLDNSADYGSDRWEFSDSETGDPVGALVLE